MHNKSVNRTTKKLRFRQPVTSNVRPFPRADTLVSMKESSMLDKFKKVVGNAKDKIASAATMVGDLNGDGKVDEEDARIAAEWTKNAASTIGQEAARLGKEVVRSDMAKDAATGAAIGAAVAVPVPVIGPMAGAVIGAGLGVYKNMTKKGSADAKPLEAKFDIHAELLKLDDLRQKNIINEVEFEAKKKQILSGR